MKWLAKLTWSGDRGLDIALLGLWSTAWAADHWSRWAWAFMALGATIVAAAAYHLHRKEKPS